MPWLHQFIDPQGRVKPCCRFSMQKEENNNLNKKSLNEIFTGSFMNDIRHKMLHNKKINGCLRCYQEEVSHKKSLRERYNKMPDLYPEKLIADLKRPKIRWIELALSNDCNLACRMCDSRYSSKWFEDEKSFYGKTLSKTKKTKCDIKTIIPFLKNIVHIKFTGGEPLMIPDHFTLLDKIIELKNTRDMFLNYSTNLTIQPKNNLIEKWKEFKYIEIAGSFDGVDSTWELVRYPSQWKKAEQVLIAFFRLTHVLDLRMGLRSTISINNILGMGKSFNWWIKHWNLYASSPFSDNQWINPTHLTFPRFLSTTVLPQKYKNIVADKLMREAQSFSGKMKSSIISQVKYMFSKDDSRHLPELKKYTLHFDKKRKQNFFQVNPELKGLFQE